MHEHQYPTVVNLVISGDAGQRISWALGVLGIVPPDGDPQWLVASVYG